MALLISRSNSFRGRLKPFQRFPEGTAELREPFRPKHQESDRRDDGHLWQTNAENIHDLMSAQTQAIPVDIDSFKDQ